ncbi:monocarboxylate transporter 10-like protein kar isoform X1 [Rhynchophorus ferrugineus]|uniref:monocarboxylate transporter 10-like protein kar isoform X1 n=1 Tax=Rhynchophorus ferrugineus TaxID=354439 RepID=UPI003FCDFEA0
MVDDKIHHGQVDMEQNAKFLTKSESPYVTTTVAPKKNVDDYSPVDGGVRAWSIMVASFFCNGILFGVINCHGVLYNQLFETLEKEGVPNASGKAALSGSLAMGMTFFMSPLSGILTDCVGIRKTTFIGGLIASLGMFLSSFCTHNITGFCFTYGIMYGLGGSLAYTPSLAVLGHYFKRYLGIVNGVACTGSSVFTIMMPYVMDVLMQKFGLIWTLRCLALIAAFIMAVAVLFKPVKMTPSLKKVQFRDLFNVSVLTNTKYIIWITVIGLCLFGYFIPYVYVISFVNKEFPKGVDKNLPVLCIGIMSGISRLVFGYVVDKTNVNKILLQQLSFLMLGVLTMLMPLSAGNFPALLVICLGMGITDGCFISLLGPVAFELCGRDGGAQAIGFLFGVCSVPLTIGPYVAGLLYDHQRNFTLPFLLAGFNPTVASFGMLGIRCVGRKSQRSRTDSTVQEPLSPSITVAFEVASLVRSSANFVKLCSCGWDPDEYDVVLSIYNQIIQFKDLYR